MIARGGGAVITLPGFALGFAGSAGTLTNEDIYGGEKRDGRPMVLFVLLPSSQTAAGDEG